MIQRFARAIAAGGLVTTLSAATATPDAQTVAYEAAVPAWVIAPPAVSDAPVPPGAPVRILYVDQQVRIGPAQEEGYESYRIKVLSPEALAIGNLALAWAPASQRLIVHRVRIWRDGKPIDVLADQKFTVLRREDRLEQAMLDGNLTATLQVAGLQVGDELEFAATRIDSQTEPSLAPQGMMQFPIVGARGSYRLRVLDPARRGVTFAASDDVPKPAETSTDRMTDIRYEMIDPASAVLPDGAPPRYAATRLVQYSSFATWPAVSRTFAPLFAAAATLPAASPVRQEAARIAALTPDPRRRAELALQTVEDRIRYVYVGLDGGNYRPAAADLTWQRRFGDCKAKTALLIALLAALDLPAEPVLVTVGPSDGDGIDRRLPSPASFNHVVVRVALGGTRYWLDGTRLGDRSLAMLEAPRSRWALPLRAAGAPLEPIAPQPPRRPGLVQAIEIDATAGFDKPARWRVQQALRGDEVTTIRAQLAGLAPADADRMLAAYWRKRMEVEPTRTSWRFDEANRLLVFTLEGEGKLDWDKDAAGVHTHYLYGGGISPPATYKRPKDQPQDAAWATDYPEFNCYATTVSLPAPGKGMHWAYSARPVDRTLGGVEYYRVSSFRDNVARVVMSRRVIVPEIGATQAQAVNAAMPGFDNNKSYAYEATGIATAASIDAGGGDEAALGSLEAFAGADPPCSSRRVAAAG